MRAAAKLYSAGDPGGDLRVPVALALVELYGVDAPDDELTALVAVMAPIEARELAGEVPSSSRSSPANATAGE